MKSAIAAATAATLAALLLVAMPAMAQMPTVERVVAVARPPRYQGPCPVHFSFIATIFVTHPTTVTYRWERSDRAMGPVETVFIRGSGQSVTTSWQIGGPPGRVFEGFETLHVLSPTNVVSNAANVSALCR